MPRKKKIDEPKVEKTSDSEMNVDDIPTDDEDGEMKQPGTATGVDEAPEDSEDDTADDGIPTSQAGKVQLETQVEDTVVHAIVHPKVIANICEQCGVAYQGKWFYDPHPPIRGWRPAKASDPQSKVVQCKHYSHLALKCSYCKNPEINKERALFIYSLPEKPEILIVCCEDYRCNVAHRKRFGLKG